MKYEDMNHSQRIGIPGVCVLKKKKNEKKEKGYFQPDEKGTIKHLWPRT